MKKPSVHRSLLVVLAVGILVMLDYPQAASRLSKLFLIQTVSFAMLGAAFVLNGLETENAAEAPDHSSLGGEHWFTSAPKTVDPDLLQFIRLSLNSFIKCDAVRFFYNNSSATYTPGFVAHFLGKETISVEAALNELVLNGVLRIEDNGRQRQFALTTNPAIRSYVEKFVCGFAAPAFRLNVLYRSVNPNA